MTLGLEQVEFKPSLLFMVNEGAGQFITSLRIGSGNMHTSLPSDHLCQFPSALVLPDFLVQISREKVRCEHE